MQDCENTNMMPKMYSLESEREIVGAILSYGNKAMDGLGDLSERHFYDKQYGMAFLALRELLGDDKPHDLFTVTDRLDGDGALQDKLIDAMRNSASINVKRYADIVIERANAREAFFLAQKLIYDLHAGKGYGADEQIQNLARALDDLAVSREDTDATFDAAELMRIGLAEFERRVDCGGEFTGLETGIKSLDDKLMGLQGGSLYVMGGRPGMGKTAASMTIADNVSEKYANDGAVLVFNLEMSKEQLGLRALSATVGISLSDLQKGYGGDSGENYDKAVPAAAKALKRKMFVDVRADITIGKIRAKARQVKNKHGLTLIVIDYLGLIDEPNKRFDSENNRIAWITRQIKKIAKELDVPVLLLAQLSRKVEERADKRPVMADLRDSGAIEQDADAIIFCYRDGYYTKDKTDDMLELIVAKQRMGETGTAFACFEGRYSRVVGVSDDYINGIHAKREIKNSNARRTA